MSSYDWDWLRGRLAEVLRARGYTALPIPLVRAMPDGEGEYRYTIEAPPNYPENVPLWCFGEIAVAMQGVGVDETVAIAQEMLPDHPQLGVIIGRIRAAFNQASTPAAAFRAYKQRRTHREDVVESLVMAVSLARTPEAAEAVRRGKVSIKAKVLAEE